MRTLLLALALFAASCATVPPADQKPEIASVIDEWHKAASAANEERYFGLMTSDAVFLGTDATERWDVNAFRAYAHPHFSAGKGWTFVPRSRNVIVAPSGDVAWFDEVLDSASYGECRGTGVLRRESGVWRIAHYNLTIPIPNDLAKDFVARIRAPRYR